MRKQSAMLLLSAAIALMMSSGDIAAGGVIALANGGFNDNIPAYPGSGPFTEENPVSGWTFNTNDPGVGFARSTNEVGAVYPGPSEGSGYLTIYKASWIFQETTHTLTEGESYTFSLDVADYSGNAGWLHVQFMAGPTEPSAAQLSALMIPNESIADVAWNSFSTSFDATAANIAAKGATAGQPLWVRITSGASDGTAWIYADNCQFTYVPEPITIVLLGLGGMMLRRRRRS